MAVGGNLSVSNNAGGGFATAVLRHQVSFFVSAEFTVSAGLRALIGAQMSRSDVVEIEIWFQRESTIGGLLGSGGGFVLGPLLLEIGVILQVSGKDIKVWRSAGLQYLNGFVG
ncbi:hypothetical protein C5167_017703 [Papaver somniferum]|uniref:Uncharacterized protein n=1 Tax=Papaver somniferum TaxID=3469 RepID=A0A4Y7IK43_PAPSO|nr:hypothetical protein C5167_017703 [Papaver somniferum]